MEMPDITPEDLAFEPAEIDLVLREGAGDDENPVPAGPQVSRSGDLFRLNDHRLLCGNALIEADMLRLMGKLIAAMMFADPPYNVPIDGFVSGRGRHREFAMGVGEMSPSEFVAFLDRAIDLAVRFSRGGAVHFLCMDWRHIGELQSAAKSHYGDLLNMCVWVKDKAGLGSMWRSQHELVFAYRVGSARQRNNVQLGRFGRSRSNVWKYPSASTFIPRDESGHLLKGHPTPKPTALCADAMLDCTVRGDVVLDPFLGTGTTLIAAEKVGRRCHGMELDPGYVDLAIRRWQAWTGADAIHDETGLTFDALADARGKEVDHD
jgi:DNA modification methylase